MMKESCVMHQMYADIQNKKGVKLAMIKAYRNLFIRENAGHIMIWTTGPYTVSEQKRV